VQPVAEPPGANVRHFPLSDANRTLKAHLRKPFCASAETVVARPTRSARKRHGFGRAHQRQTRSKLLRLHAGSAD
jgi:hypothetical protein